MHGLSRARGRLKKDMNRGDKDRFKEVQSTKGLAWDISKWRNKIHVVDQT